MALLISSTVGKLALKGEKTPRLRTLREIRHMLQERVARWPEQWLEQGRQEGLKLGKVEDLKALARHRFGELPPLAAGRIDGADVDCLDRWFRRLLDAKRLDDVFGD